MKDQSFMMWCLNLWRRLIVVDTYMYTVDGIKVRVSQTGILSIAHEDIQKLVRTATVQKQVHAMRKIMALKR